MGNDMVVTFFADDPDNNDRPALCEYRVPAVSAPDTTAADDLIDAVPIRVLGGGFSPHRRVTAEVRVDAEPWGKLSSDGPSIAPGMYE